MPCRSGCSTGDHSSWGECARVSVRFATPWSVSAQRERLWFGELEAYRCARSQGIQPAGTTRAAVDSAVRVSRAKDAAFDATTGRFG